MFSMRRNFWIFIKLETLVFSEYTSEEGPEKQVGCMNIVSVKGRNIHWHIKIRLIVGNHWRDD